MGGVAEWRESGTSHWAGQLEPCRDPVLFLRCVFIRLAVCHGPQGPAQQPARPFPNALPRLAFLQAGEFICDNSLGIANCLVSIFIRNLDELLSPMHFIQMCGTSLGVGCGHCAAGGAGCCAVCCRVRAPGAACPPLVLPRCHPLTSAFDCRRRRRRPAVAAVRPGQRRGALPRRRRRQPADLQVNWPPHLGGCSCFNVAFLLCFGNEEREREGWHPMRQQRWSTRTPPALPACPGDSRHPMPSVFDGPTPTPPHPGRHPFSTATKTTHVSTHPPTTRTTPGRCLGSNNYGSFQCAGDGSCQLPFCGAGDPCGPDTCACVAGTCNPNTATCV